MPDGDARNSQFETREAQIVVALVQPGYFYVNLFVLGPCSRFWSHPQLGVMQLYFRGKCPTPRKVKVFIWCLSLDTYAKVGSW